MPCNATLRHEENPYIKAIQLDVHFTKDGVFLGSIRIPAHCFHSLLQKWQRRRRLGGSSVLGISGKTRREASITMYIIMLSALSAS